MKPLLRVEGLVVGYGKVSVARDVDLEVGEGEVVALLGPDAPARRRRCLTIGASWHLWPVPSASATSTRALSAPTNAPEPDSPS